MSSDTPLSLASSASPSSHVLPPRSASAETEARASREYAVPIAATICSVLLSLNGLQTNGTLLNRAWAEFLARERFSVGLSLDGPAGMHDAFRRDAAGKGSHEKAEAAFRLLTETSVFVNVLCVLHSANAGDIAAQRPAGG